jgi:hypothetical protein
MHLPSYPWGMSPYNLIKIDMGALQNHSGTDQQRNLHPARNEIPNLQMFHYTDRATKLWVQLTLHEALW